MRHKIVCIMQHAFFIFIVKRMLEYGKRDIDRSQHRYSDNTVKTAQLECLLLIHI